MWHFGIQDSASNYTAYRLFGCGFLSASHPARTARTSPHCSVKLKSTVEKSKSFGGGSSDRTCISYAECGRRLAGFGFWVSVSGSQGPVKGSGLGGLQCLLLRLFLLFLLLLLVATVAIAPDRQRFTTSSLRLLENWTTGSGRRRGGQC